MIPGKLQEEFFRVCTNHCLPNKAGILKFLSSLTAGQRVLWAPVPRRPAKDADATAKFVQHILMLCLIWFPGWDEFYEQVFWLIRWLILFKWSSISPETVLDLLKYETNLYCIVRRGLRLHSPVCQASQVSILALRIRILTPHLAESPSQSTNLEKHELPRHLASSQTRAESI